MSNTNNMTIDQANQANASQELASKASVDTGAASAGKFFPYISGVLIPAIEGFREVIATYKQTPGMKKKGIAAKPNVYVRVPSVHISTQSVKESIDQLAPYIVQYLREVENDLVKGYHRDGCTQVFTETLSLERVIQVLEDSGNSGLNAELITEWYEGEVAEPLVILLLAKVGENPSSKAVDKCNQVVQSYLDTFISLASGKTQLSEQQRERLAKCLHLTGTEESNLGVRFLAKFDRMAKKEQEALNGLGDLDL